jgi:hypothetical protein
VTRSPRLYGEAGSTVDVINHKEYRKMEHDITTGQPQGDHAATTEDLAVIETPDMTPDDDEETGDADERGALLERLREAMLAADPSVDPELVQGTSLAELEASFERAKAVTERLRGVIRASDGVRVPAGAPGRATPPPRSAFEKIRDGLQRGS